MSALVVAQRHDQDRADALDVIGVVLDAGVGEDVVRALQLAGAHADARQAAGHRQPGARRRRSGPGARARRPRSSRPPTPVAPVSARLRSAMTRMTVAGVEPRRRHRLLHLDHRLEQLGVEPHLLLGQLALGDVELGAEVADLAALLVADRLPRAGAPADLAGAGDDAGTPGRGASRLRPAAPTRPAGPGGRRDGCTGGIPGPGCLRRRTRSGARRRG